MLQFQFRCLLTCMVVGSASAFAGELSKGETVQRRVDRYGDPLPPGARLRLGRPLAKVNCGVWSLAYSPDSKLLISTTHRKVRLWDLATGKEIRQFLGHNGVVGSAAFSPDGRSVAALDSNSLCAWETGTGKLVHKLDRYTHGKDRGIFCAMTFSPDGQTIATAGWENTIHFWDAATFKERRQFTGPGIAVRWLEYSHDGQFLASLDDNKDIRLWNVATGKTVHQFKGSMLAFLPDGKTLATGLAEGQKDTIRLWDIGTGKELRQITGAYLAFTRLAVSPDGKTLVSGGYPSAVCLWDVTTGKLLRRFAHRGPIGAVAFSPDGKTVASGSWDQTFRVWDVATGQQIHSFPGDLGQVWSVAVAPDGKTVATGSDEVDVGYLWDVANGRNLGAIPVGKLAYSGAVMFSPDGRSLASYGAFRPLRIWDLAASKERPGLRTDPDESIWQFAFSPDGRLFASADRYGRIRVRDAATAKKLGEYPWRLQPLERDEEFPPVTSLTFSPDSKYFVAAALFERDFHLWSLDTGRIRHSFRLAERDGAGVSGWRDVVFSPDGRTLAGLGRHGESQETTIHLWELASGKGRLRFAAPPMPLNSLAFSPDGRILATGGKDGVIRLWDVSDGNEFEKLAGHLGAVNSVAFVPDGTTLISGSEDTTVLFWDVPAAMRKPPRENAAPSPKQLEVLWSELASEDARAAYRAMIALSRIMGASGETVTFLRERVRLIPPVDVERVVRLISELESNVFAIRDNAQRALEALGPLAKPALDRACSGHSSLETRRRCEDLLERLDGMALRPEELRALRAIEALEKAGTSKSRQTLEELARGAAGAWITEEARRAAQRLAPKSAAR